VIAALIANPVITANMVICSGFLTSKLKKKLGTKLLHERRRTDSTSLGSANPITYGFFVWAVIAAFHLYSSNPSVKGLSYFIDAYQYRY
jgi:hypothetical protein